MSDSTTFAAVPAFAPLQDASVAAPAVPAMIPALPQVEAPASLEANVTAFQAVPQAAPQAAPQLVGPYSPTIGNAPVGAPLPVPRLDDAQASGIEAAIANAVALQPPQDANKLLVDAYVAQLTSSFRQGLAQPGMTVPAINSWIETSGIFTPEQIAAIRKNYDELYAFSSSSIKGYIVSPQNGLLDADPAMVPSFINVIVAVLSSSYGLTNGTSPWAILRNLQNIPQALQLFGIPQGTNTLQVKVTSGPNTYHHQFTEDQVLGILLYPEQLPVQLSMYDQPITRDFLRNLPSSYHEGYVLLSIGEQNYVGHDASLLSGYFTGGEWSGKTRADLLPSMKISVVQAGQLVPVKVA